MLTLLKFVGDGAVFLPPLRFIHTRDLNLAISLSDAISIEIILSWNFWNRDVTRILPVQIVSLSKIALTNSLCKHYFKVGLHYGDYRSKLGPFEEQKNIFYIQKRL